MMDVNDFLKIIHKIDNFKKEIEVHKSVPEQNFQHISSPSFEDIAVLTATQDEFDSFSSYLSDFTTITVENDANLYFKGYIKTPKNDISVIMPLPTDMGIASAAIIATKCINYFRPRYLFMVGIAAGIKATTKIGDVIIADKALDYNEVVEIESANKTVRTKFMNNMISISPNLKSRVQMFLKNFQIEKEQPSELFNLSETQRKIMFHFGIMVSGSSLIRSNERIEQLVRDFHNIKGIDMETIGVYKAVNTFGKDIMPIFMSIKSVSDYGTNQIDKEFENATERKKIALHTASSTLFHFIRSNYLI